MYLLYFSIDAMVSSSSAGIFHAIDCRISKMAVAKITLQVYQSRLSGQYFSSFLFFPEIFDMMSFRFIALSAILHEWFATLPMFLTTIP
jgi:hypothetical protein